MARKASAIAAIEEMNDATRAAVAAKEKALAAIPMYETQQHIPWDRLVQDMEFNVRDALTAYDPNNNRELYQSLKEFGLLVRGGDNMSFSFRVDDSYLILSGNVRYNMMLAIRNEEQARRDNENILTTDENPLPFNEVFGLVFKRLTRDQEVALMADHTMKRGLNDYELTKEVAVFSQASGSTDAKLSVKFGMDSNKIRRYRYRYSMPTVYEEYRKQHGPKGTPFYPVINTALDLLYAEYYKDTKAGNAWRQEGVNFKRAWRAFVSTPSDTGIKLAVPKSVSRETIMEQIATFEGTHGSTPEVQKVADILSWAANEKKDGSPVSMQSAVVDLKEYCDSMRESIATAGDTILSLKAELQETKELLEQAVKDYDGAQEEIEELKSTIANLTQSLNASPNS